MEQEDALFSVLRQIFSFCVYAGFLQQLFSHPFFTASTGRGQPSQNILEFRYHESMPLNNIAGLASYPQLECCDIKVH